MSFADKVMAGSSNDSENNDESDLSAHIEEWSPNPEHTKAMLADSESVKAEVLEGLFEELEEADNPEEVKEKYEAYREVVDFRRATGKAMGEADYSNTDFTEGVEEWDSYDDAEPINGAVLGPLYAWNKGRISALRKALSEVGGNLPAYKAVFPEPETDELVIWQEVDEVGPEGHDSHIYGDPEVVADFEMCPEGIPPETEEEYLEHLPETPTESNDSEEEQEQCAAIASTTGDRCAKTSKPGSKLCGHHIDTDCDMVDTTDYNDSEDSEDSDESEEGVTLDDLTDEAKEQLVSEVVDQL